MGGALPLYEDEDQPESEDNELRGVGGALPLHEDEDQPESEDNGLEQKR